MPTRVDVDQSAVLEAVVKQLINAYPGGGLSDKTCYLADEPDAPEDPVDDLYITVSMGNGTFNNALFVGGGPKQCSEETQVIVSIWCRVESDEPGHNKEALTNRNSGILRHKARVLRALAGADLQINYPENAGGTNNFLRQWLIPITATVPEKKNENGYSGLAIVFGADFDWDLTS
jgi:hypothetical protein